AGTTRVEVGRLQAGRPAPASAQNPAPRKTEQAPCHHKAWPVGKRRYLAPRYGERRMFHQLLTPVGDSLLLSFLVATIPIIVVLMMLGVLRRPAWQASLAGLAVALVIAIGVWQMPVHLAASSTAAGVAFALWPIMWI